MFHFPYAGRVAIGRMGLTSNGVRKGIRPQMLLRHNIMQVGRFLTEYIILGDITGFRDYKWKWVYYAGNLTDEIILGFVSG